MRFFKAHGLGNDFIIFLENLNFSKDDIINLCRPHFGIGADGVVILTKFNDEYNMSIFNKDGSMAKTCGNALRCVGKLVYLFEGKEKIIINTLSDKNQVEVRDGKIITTFKTPNYIDPKLIVLNMQEFYLVDVGNQHAMTRCENIESFDFSIYAKVLQRNYKYNLEAYQIINKNEVKARFYEYGVNETTSCTSGTVALFYHLLQSKLVDNTCSFIEKGGVLTLSYHDDGIKVEGDARILYKGELIDGEL